MKIYDSHIHSENSHDGRDTVVSIAESACGMGLTGITITDHFDCEKYSCRADFEHIYKSMRDIESAKVLFDGKLEIFKGAEIGDWMYRKETGDTFLKTGNPDFILASLHSAATGSRCIPGFSGYRDFAKTSYQQDCDFLDYYYDSMVYTAENADFDSLAHLTYPLRYMNGMCKKNMSLDNQQDKIIHILKTLISREKALEINTSGLKGDWLVTTMPSEDILKIYRSLGGELITVGSDSHTADGIALGFEKTFDMLRSVGFDKYYHYKNRLPVSVSL